MRPKQNLGSWSKFGPRGNSQKPANTSFRKTFKKKNLFIQCRFVPVTIFKGGLSQMKIDILE